MADDRNLILIDADGRLSLDPEAQRRLAGRPGRFRVVPTTGEIILLQRVAAERTNTSVSTITPGRVTLAGEIDAAGGMVDVINFILSNQWSGQLAVLEGQSRKTIHFLRGDVRSAASNVAEDRLGAILYRFGIITDDQLQTALRASGGSARLGQVLVQRGLISAHDLYTYVRKQVEEIFFTLLTLRSGTFYFYRTDEEHGPVSQLSLSTKQLLFDGVRRIDELSYFRAKLPANDLILARRQPAPPQKLEHREERLLDLVDGARDLSAISRLSQLGEFEAIKILYQLLTSGFVEPKRDEPMPAPTRDGLDLSNSIEDIYSRVIDTFNDVYVKIHSAVAQRGKSEAMRAALDSFFGSVAEFAPLFVGLDVARDGTLNREQLLSNLSMAPTDDKLDYVHRGLNELLFFELFTAGEAVDRREEQELHQRLNQIMRDRAPPVREMTAEPEDADRAL